MAFVQLCRLDNYRGRYVASANDLAHGKGGEDVGCKVFYCWREYAFLVLLMLCEYSDCRE